MEIKINHGGSLPKVNVFSFPPLFFLGVAGDTWGCDWGQYEERTLCMNAGKDLLAKQHTKQWVKSRIVLPALSESIPGMHRHTSRAGTHA